MKHGDKAKAKAAKASRKASDKKTSKTGSGTQKGKAAKAVKTSPGKSSGAKVSAPKASLAPSRTGNGRSSAETAGFTNPAIAAAFKRAVKKYPNAFRRLTD